MQVPRSASAQVWDCPVLDTRESAICLQPTNNRTWLTPQPRGWHLREGIFKEWEVRKNIKQSCRHQDQCRRGGRGAPNTWVACDEVHDETGCLPAAHGGSYWSRCPYQSLWRTTCYRTRIPEGICRPWIAHTEAGSCQKLKPRERIPQWSRLAGKSGEAWGTQLSSPFL